jgi:hypothetical protein
MEVAKAVAVPVGEGGLVEVPRLLVSQDSALTPVASTDVVAVTTTRPPMRRRAWSLTLRGVAGLATAPTWFGIEDLSSSRPTSTKKRLVTTVRRRRTPPHLGDALVPLSTILPLWSELAALSSRTTATRRGAAGGLPLHFSMVVEIHPQVVIVVGREDMAGCV